MGLTTRFEPSQTTQHLSKVEEFVIGVSDVSYVQNFYKDDFEDYAQLQLHRDILLDQAKANKKEIQKFDAVFSFLKENDSLAKVAHQMVKLIRIVLCMPVSNCTSERSFSGLRRLKTYLRSTMTQERLNHLAVLSVHREVLESVDFNKLTDEFIKRAQVRMNTFSLSQ
jgi:hypothetical protein